jgi:hypothetical protein
MIGSTSPGKVWGPLCPALIGARNLEGSGTHEVDSKITKVRGSVEGVKACAFLLRGWSPQWCRLTATVLSKWLIDFQ